eukprot:c8174_g1_i2 orf=18-386(-)
MCSLSCEDYCVIKIRPSIRLDQHACGSSVSGFPWSVTSDDTGAISCTHRLCGGPSSASSAGSTASPSDACAAMSGNRMKQRKEGRMGGLCWVKSSVFSWCLEQPPPTPLKFHDILNTKYLNN